MSLSTNVNLAYDFKTPEVTCTPVVVLKNKGTRLMGEIKVKHLFVLNNADTVSLRNYVRPEVMTVMSNQG